MNTAKHLLIPLINLIEAKIVNSNLLYVN